MEVVKAAVEAVEAEKVAVGMVAAEMAAAAMVVEARVVEAAVEALREGRTIEIVTWACRTKGLSSTGGEIDGCSARQRK